MQSLMSSNEMYKYKAKKRKLIGNIEVFKNEITDGEYFYIQYERVSGYVETEHAKAEIKNKEIFFYSSSNEKIINFNECLAVFCENQTILYPDHLWQKINDICWGYEDCMDVHEKLIELITQETDVKHRIHCRDFLKKFFPKYFNKDKEKR